MTRWLVSVSAGIAFLAGCDSPVVAEQPDVLTFSDEKAGLKVVYTVGPPIRVDVHSGSVIKFTRSFSGDYRTPNVKFLEINGDVAIDIIVELADESGFEPMILLSRPDGTYTRAAADLDAFVEYANLDTGADSDPAEPYRVVDVDADGINELVFAHLYLGRTLTPNVVLHLNADRSDFEIRPAVGPDAKVEPK
jgi:hypothetical protein